MEWDKHGICNYSKHISWVLLAEEIFIFDEMTNKIYLLRDIQKEFWLLIDGKKNIADIITETYNLTSLSIEEIKKLLNKFIIKMNKKKLIEWVIEDEQRNTD